MMEDINSNLGSKRIQNKRNKGTGKAAGRGCRRSADVAAGKRGRKAAGMLPLKNEMK